MKMSPEHFAVLRHALMETLAAHDLHPFQVNSTRHAWDVFSKASQERRFGCVAFYDHYDDSHIETALKRVFKR